ncbi:hypothetical protein SAMN04488040_1230 [Sulfitobacter marinus]|uniref:Uncharacterized protein n=1 Tax=Sulfitobacter marinus TaxID=394264 RepID=A0A1I6RG74_9RHOB|nr:hypothetical protein [Sulfitobacter marinus]SFS63702.1 hypothetical protein SAMN04488040_1230 [Sulfitobacter marinus]
MTTLTIPAGEHGQIRLFAVNRPVEVIASMLQSNDKAAAISDLLGFTVPSGSAELFAVSDLTGVGLPRYLTDGYAVTEAQINADRARLDALEGYVLLLFSSAFDGAETTLDIGPDLTLIGTYGEEQPAMAAPPLTADAAQPYTGVPNLTPTTPPRGRAGGAVMVLALIVALGLILWWLL